MLQIQPGNLVEGINIIYMTLVASIRFAGENPYVRAPSQDGP